MMDVLRKSWKRYEWITFAVCGYVIIIGLTVLIWNEASGERIQQWYGEYVGANGELTGSGQWRDSSPFPTFTLLLGSWVYPLAFVGIGLLVPLIRDARTTKARRLLVAAALANVAIVAAFIYLGVFYSVSRF